MTNHDTKIEIVSQDDPRAEAREAQYSYLDRAHLVVLVNGESAAIYDAEENICFPYDEWAIQDEDRWEYEMEFDSQEQAIKMLADDTPLVRKPVY